MPRRSRTRPVSPRTDTPIDAPDDPARFQEAIDAFEKRVPMSPAAWDALEEDAREFAFKVAGATQADLVTDVWKAIDEAIANGETLEDFKDRIADDLEEAWGKEDPARLETIFRTNVQTAYNAGRHAVYTAPAVKEARPFLRFDAIEDDRTDDVCADIDGTVLEQEDPFWANHTPPLHFNCRCQIVPLSPEEANEEGVDEEAPDAEADEGFGSAPSEEGSDWEPDPRDYPSDIAEILRGNLAD